MMNGIGKGIIYIECYARMEIDDEDSFQFFLSLFFSIILFI